ncbi:MAG: recombination mediator RecR [Clostridia bacterium]|nr:recombination mediator RecR [Clostridia bacterium]
MNNADQPIELLARQFTKIRGVGLKTARRYALSIIKMSSSEVDTFARTMVETKKNVKFCSLCGGFSTEDVCDLCKTRDKSVLCVVKDAKDILSMEKAKTFNGVYHALGGVLSPLDNIGPENLRIGELLSRLNDVKEVIIATNPDIEGEATALYIAKLIKPLGVKVTRIAQGLTIGSDLEYADEMTLSRALEDRREI